MKLLIIKQCSFLILLLHYCTVLATSTTHHSLERSRFFEFTAANAPGPNGNLGAPGPSPVHIGPVPGPTSPPNSPILTPPGASGAPPPWNSDPSSSTSAGSSSSSGLNGGQKAGIAIGSLAGAGLLVFGGMVYKTRRSNIRRTRLATAARTPML